MTLLQRLMTEDLPGVGLQDHLGRCLEDILNTGAQKLPGSGIRWATGAIRAARCTAVRYR